MDPAEGPWDRLEVRAVEQGVQSLELVADIHEDGQGSMLNAVHFACVLIGYIPGDVLVAAINHGGSR